MEWTVIFIASAAIASVLSALHAFTSAVRARHETVSLARRTRSNELQIESLHNSSDLLTAELQRFANSKKMSDVRAATEHVKPTKKRSSVISSEPDPAEDPEAWRTWMNAQLRINPRTNQ